MKNTVDELYNMDKKEWKKHYKAGLDAIDMEGNRLRTFHGKAKTMTFKSLCIAFTKLFNYGQEKSEGL